MSTCTLYELAGLPGAPSYSTITRLKREGFLAPYLIEHKGRQVQVELEPVGREPLLQHLQGLVRFRHQAIPRKAGAPPTAEAAGTGREDYWRVWGRWEPGQKLTPEQEWKEVSRILQSFLSTPNPLSAIGLAELFTTCAELLADVKAGARFDPTRFAIASAEGILRDCEWFAADQIPVDRLEDLLDSQRLPPQLADQVSEALQKAKTAAAQPLSVAIA